MSNKVVLKNLVNIDSGFAFKSYLFTEDDQYIPIIRIRDVNSGVATTYYSGEYDEKYIVNNGDLLISMDGSFIIKKWNGGKALLNQRVCRIKSVSDKITDDYLFRILPKELKAIEDKTPFVTVKHLSVKSIENIEINLPSLEIQNKVVEVLDKAQELIDKRKLQIKALDELVKSRFIEMFGDPIKNPNGFKVEKLSDISESFIGLTYKPDDVYDDGILVLRSGNIQNSKLVFDDSVRINTKVREKLFVKENDILMCSRNGSARLVGKVAMIPKLDEEVTFGAFMTIISSSNYAYLFTYFQLEAFRQQLQSAKTTTINQITKKMLDEIVVPLPPIELQNEFADFVKQVDQLKSQMETSLKELEDNFNSLMQKAFKGELF